MIIDELVFYNFGTFGGRQVVRMDPPSREQPIILFGGLNGAGKTTLLEGLQLALFGKLAPPARDAGGSYETYLIRSIHRRGRPKDGASVEVKFRSTGEGHERQYHIRRSWAVKRQNVVEQLEALVDGVSDPALAETWPEQVHRFLPPQLASLFLFDGERIEALADPDNSEGFLAIAIDALLGMDLVRQLEADLTVLERRKRAETLSDKARKRLDEESATLNEFDEAIKGKKTEAGGLRNKLDAIAYELKLVEREYREQGGDLLQRRESLEDELSDLRSGAAEHRRVLVEVAAGALPLCIVRNELTGLIEQADREAKIRRTRDDLNALLSHRDGIEAKLGDTSAAEEALRALGEYFSEIESRLSDENSPRPTLNVGEGTREIIRRLLANGLDNEHARARGIAQQLSSTEDRLDEVERQLAMVPEADAIRNVAVRREELVAKQAALQESLDELVLEIEGLETKRSRQLERVDQVLKDAASEGLEEERRERLLEHSAWAKETLVKFRQAALERNLERIEDLVLECYQSLLRKRSLVASVRIEPDSYRMRLYNAENEEVSALRLSAGERQLLAVATLWGLGRAAGRPLPVVIDTPLGRLDGGHRTHLIARYFPEASHQVILLSTDEEIVGNYLEKLSPWIGRSYRLEYDDETESTRIEEGYFEETEAA